jgi:hypothetical protein
MLFSLVVPLSVLSLANGLVMRRDKPLNIPKTPNNPPDPGMQSIPTTGKADNSFNNGAVQLIADPDGTDVTPPAVYGAREIDLPFGRLYHGNAKFFPAGQLNTPTGNFDRWVPDGLDSANQSACGIPDNAYFISKVAIHPYFLKYADLSRKLQATMPCNIENSHLTWTYRLLYARRLYLLLERRRHIRYDAESHGYLQHRSQRSNTLRNPCRYQDRSFQGTNHGEA